MSRYRIIMEGELYYPMYEDSNGWCHFREHTCEISEWARYNGTLRPYLAFGTQQDAVSFMVGYIDKRHTSMIVWEAEASGNKNSHTIRFGY